MKRVIILIAFLISSVSLFAQTPEKLSYQAVLRNNSNELIVSSAVSIKIIIRQGGVNGEIVYEEKHNVTTNANGLVTLQIGTGSDKIGDFSTIDWSKGMYFTETQLNMNESTNYDIIGISQLLSVPYALHSKTAETVINAPKQERARIISFTSSRTVLSGDINNTIECTTSAILKLPLNFSEMEIGDTINLEAHNGAILTINASPGVSINYNAAGSAVFNSEAGVVRFGLLRKSGNNSYIVSGQ